MRIGKFVHHSMTEIHMNVVFFHIMNSWPDTSDSHRESTINPNQLSPGQKCPGDNFFFNALFVSEHFKHFEIYLFLTHFGG